jgi:hypothetical protein
MPANNDPIYSRVGSLSNNNVASPSSGMNQPITAAANDFTGAGANNSLVATADAINGGFFQRLRFIAGGTNSQSMARVFINNGGSPTTAANNTFIGEIPLPVTTASTTVPMITPEFTLNMALDPGFRIYVGLTTAPGAGWSVLPVAGRY